MKDTRSKTQVRLAAAKRLLMRQYLRKPLDLVLVPEFPKSGGSWFCQMFSDATSIPFPRNVSPNFERCIIHGHFLYKPSFGKTLAVLRDGRDVMVSAYYHFLFEHDRNPSYSIQYHRSRLHFEEYEDIQSNMPRFIEYMFTDYAAGRFHFSWSDFVNSYLQNENIYLVTYENLLKDAQAELSASMTFLGINHDREQIGKIVEKYSFKNQTKREPGTENKKSFLRKGIAGDWKNNFNQEACEVFNKLGGNELILAGYEKDKNWF